MSTFNDYQREYLFVSRRIRVERARAHLYYSIGNVKTNIVLNKVIYFTVLHEYTRALCTPLAGNDCTRVYTTKHGNSRLKYEIYSHGPKIDRRAVLHALTSAVLFVSF